MNSERIQIVDDEREMVKFIAKCLEKMGFVVSDIATTGESAVAAARRSKPDLVLMDINLLGKMDGIEAATRIRSQLHIPVVYLTGSDDEETIQRAKLSEPLGYLIKPFKPRELKTTIETALYTFRATRDRVKENHLLADERYRSVLENAIEGIFRAGPSGTLIEANQAAVRMMGFESAEEILNSGITLQALFDMTATQDMELRQKLEAGGMVEGLELEVLRTDGQKTVLRVNIRAIRDTFGAIDHLEGSAIDITARKEAEEKLRVLARAVEQSPVSVVITDIGGRIEYVNPKFIQLTGYALSDVRGKNPRILKSGLMPEEVYKELWGTILCGEEWHGELQNRKRNGELYWEYVSICPMVDASGVITHFIAVKEDITARKRMQDLVMEQERRFRDLIESLPHLFWICKPDGTFDYLSRQWVEYTGIPAEPQTGSGWLQQVHPDDLERAAAAWRQSLQSGCNLDLECRIRAANGGYRWFRTRVVPMRNANGQIAKWYGSNTDIDNEKRSSEK